MSNCCFAEYKAGEGPDHSSLVTRHSSLVTCHSSLLPVVHAIVPMKQLQRAKSRLASRLNAEERRNLALDMLVHVLQTLQAPVADQSSPIAQTWVASSDPAILALASELGAWPLFDEASDLNGALEQARQAARAAGAGALLVVHADLPLLRPADVQAMVQSLIDGNDLVLAPDSAGEGTNAMGLLIDTPLAFQFEGRSFGRHLAAAAWQELLVSVVRSPTLALDIDTPESLTEWVVKGNKEQ
jgi:2-phospho-L-lactate/phosphoenolpyruvate guanylyltransferase